MEFTKSILKFIKNWKYPFSVTLATFKQINNPDKAISIFEGLLEKNPKDGPILAMLGMTLVREEKTESGVKKLLEALKYIQNDDYQLQDIYAYLGYGYLILKNYEEAKRFNLLALKHWDETKKPTLIDFTKDQIYENIGISYEMEKAYNKAIEYFEKALKINSQDTSILERLIRAYHMNGDNYEAKKKLKELLSIDPSLEHDEKCIEASIIIDKSIDKMSHD